MASSRRIRFAMPRPLRLMFLVCAALALGGCAGARHHPAQSRTAGRLLVAHERACPGADPCPYSSVTIIGRRGEGVLRFPEALAVAPDGEVYVADQFSYVVQRFSASGHFLGQWGAHGARPGQFGAVGGLAVDHAGDVYLVDSSNDRVEQFDAHGHFLRAWGSAGTHLGQFRFGSGGSGMPPGGGIAVAGGYLYISDTGNDRIERFTLDGAHAFAWGTRGHGPAQLEAPWGLAVRGDTLYVADAGNDRIETFRTDSAYLGQMGELGSSAGHLKSPLGVAVGPHGQVYVADDNNHRVVELTAGLGYVTEWTLYPLQGEGEGLHPNFGSEEVSYPRAVAASSTGAVYVADAAASQIDVIDPAGQLAGTWGVSARSSGQFIVPWDVVATPAGDVVVGDAIGGRVERFDRTLAFRASLHGGAAIVGAHLFKPVALALAQNGSLWVTDQENGLLRHLSAASSPQGEGELLGTLGSAPGLDGSLHEPIGVAVGRHGDIYVADAGQDLIRHYSPAGTLVGSWGGSGSTPGRFHSPIALAVAPSGNVYVADLRNARVEQFTADGRYVRTWGGPGTAPGAFDGPDGVAVDARGEVFVSDGGNDRIEEFSADGRFLRMWGVPGATAGELSGPAGLAVDCAGALLVADADNNRVQRFAGVAPPGRCASS